MPLLIETSQKWHDFLAAETHTGKELLDMRLACYKEIQKIRKRPVLVYASRFVDSSYQQSSISISDVDGFTDLITSIPSRYKAVDVILHSPGGSPDATERIVSLLRSRFNEIHFLVPHSAYSAATMLALSGNSITLHPSSTLGPIDPQINGIPARSIQRGFEKVKENIKEEGPEALPAYIPLIEKYTIDLLELCDDSSKLSKSLVEEWMGKYMFHNDASKAEIATKAAEYFSNYDHHLIHSRPISFEKIEKYGLPIQLADKRLATLMWQAYILLNGFFSVSNFVKLFENQYGISWGRQLPVMNNTQVAEQQLQHPL